MSTVEPSDESEADKAASPLDEMLVWLHDKLPLTEKELQGLSIGMQDFQMALKSVQPSAKREGFATVPNTTWDDVGSLKDIREELQMSIVVSNSIRILNINCLGVFSNCKLITKLIILDRLL